MMYMSIMLKCEQCNALTRHSFVWNDLFWCRRCYKASRPGLSEEEEMLRNGMCPCGSVSHKGCSVAGCALYVYQELSNETYQRAQD